MLTKPNRNEKSFVASPHLKVFQSHRLRFAFPRPLGWNDAGGDFGQKQQERAEKTRLARLAGMKKEETSSNANSVVPERKARLAGMAKKRNAGGVCKVESKSGNFVIVAPKGFYP